MMVAGGSVYEGTRYVGRQPRVVFSADGSTWSVPQRVIFDLRRFAGARATGCGG